MFSVKRLARCHLSYYEEQIVLDYGTHQIHKIVQQNGRTDLRAV